MVTVRQLMHQLIELPPDAPVFVLSPRDGDRDYDVEVEEKDDGHIQIW